MTVKKFLHALAIDGMANLCSVMVIQLPTLHMQGPYF